MCLFFFGITCASSSIVSKTNNKIYSRGKIAHLLRETVTDRSVFIEMSQVNLLVEDECENSCCESDEDFNNQPRKRAGCVQKGTGGTANGTRKMASVVVRAAAGSPNRAVDGMEPSINSSEGSGHVEAPAIDLAATSSARFNEERIRRKLQFFFMNPIEKWQARRKFPYKFVVQVSI